MRSGTVEVIVVLNSVSFLRGFASLMFNYFSQPIFFNLNRSDRLLLDHDLGCGQGGYCLHGTRFTLGLVNLGMRC